jgi:hypothetical protein
MTIRTMPSPVSAYVNATNSFNLDGLAAVFDDDALVNDHRVEFIGKEQIRARRAHRALPRILEPDRGHGPREGDTAEVTRP